MLDGSSQLLDLTDLAGALLGPIAAVVFASYLGLSCIGVYLAFGLLRSLLTGSFMPVVIGYGLSAVVMAAGAFVALFDLEAQGQALAGNYKMLRKELQKVCT